MNSNELDKNKINRVATPIKIDSTGKPITIQKEGLVIVKKEKKQSSLTTVFVIILLLILALIAFLVLYIIVPDYMNEKDRNYKVDPTTTTANLKGSYPIVSGVIGETSLINSVGEYRISDKLNISLVNSSNGMEVLVNGVFIDNADYLSNKVALLDDLMIINLIGNNKRTSKLYFVDLEGNIVNVLYKLTDDGMVLNLDAEVQYNTSSIIISSSRVVDNKLILKSDYGNLNGIDICDYKVLGENDIDETFPAISYYSFEYLGNHQFSKPVLINSIPISKYRETSNFCKNN